MTWSIIPLKDSHLFKIAELFFFFFKQKLITDSAILNKWEFFSKMVDKWHGLLEDCIISPKVETTWFPHRNSKLKFSIIDFILLTSTLVSSKKRLLLNLFHSKYNFTINIDLLKKHLLKFHAMTIEWLTNHNSWTLKTKRFWLMKWQFWVVTYISMTFFQLKQRPPNIPTVRIKICLTKLRPYLVSKF